MRSWLLLLGWLQRKYYDACARGSKSLGTVVESVIVPLGRVMKGGDDAAEMAERVDKGKDENGGRTGTSTYENAMDDGCF